MTPNTFEAYLVSGSFGDFMYLAGYVDKMKPRDAVVFIDMAKAAGGPDDVKSGMWLGGVDYRPDNGPRIRLSGYSVQDILSSGYGDVAWSYSITDDIDVNLRGQFMIQGSNGANRLTGEAFSTWVAGAGIDFSWKELTLLASYTQTASTTPYRNPYGLWPGYPPCPSRTRWLRTRTSRIALRCPWGPYATTASVDDQPRALISFHRRYAATDGGQA